MDEPACRQQALNLLARREHSRAELERKLDQRGYHADVHGPVLDALAAEHLLDEARFAASFLRSRVARGQGPMRIRRELDERGVSGDYQAAAFAEEDIDWSALAASVRRRRFGGSQPVTDFRERARQSRFLQYRGFSGEQIRAALDAGDEYD